MDDFGAPMISLMLFIVGYKPVKVHWYHHVQTVPVRTDTSSFIFYLSCMVLNYELKLHLLTLTITSLPLSEY